MKKNIFIIIFSVILFSCDPYKFNVKIDDKGFKKKFDIECAKIEVSSHVIADRQITASLKIILNSPITIDSENLKITYKGDEVSSNVYFNDNPLKKMTEISDDGEIRIALNQLIQNGDTLEVNIDKFILCKEKPLNIGNINLIFVPR